MQPPTLPQSGTHPPAAADDISPRTPQATRSLHAACAQIDLKGEDRVLITLDIGWTNVPKGARAPPRSGPPLTLLPQCGHAPGRSAASAVTTEPTSPSLFCVFDGHNGPHAAAAAADSILAALATRLPGPPPLSELASDSGDATAADLACPAAAAWRGEVAAALAAAFHDVQVSWAGRGALGGCTATVALVLGRLVTVANVGDSLGLLDTGASVVPVTGDHRVHNSRREQERVRAAGGVVTRVAETGSGPAPDAARGLGPLRVWPGGVANSRAIGDFDVQPGLLLAAPQLTQLRFPVEGGRLLLASDGVWDCVDIHRAAKCARGAAASEAADRVLAGVLRATGGVPKDDTSVVVVDVLPPGVPSFPEACGRKLKRSMSRGAAMVAAGLPADAESDRGGGSRRGGDAFLRLASRSAAGSPRGGAASSSGGGGLLSCCGGAPATVGDSDAALAASFAPADKPVRGGGYGPSVRGGAAYQGSVIGSRSPSVDAEVAAAVAGDGDGSAHSGSTRGNPSTRGGAAYHGGAPPPKPRVDTLLTLDVAVLLGHLPASPADAAARDAARGGWATDAYVDMLRAAAAKAHTMYAKRSGAAAPRRAAVAPLADETVHPVDRPTAVEAADGSMRRAGSGPTPVVAVPPLTRRGPGLATALAPPPPRARAPGGGEGGGADAVARGDAERRVHRGRVSWG